MIDGPTNAPWSDNKGNPKGNTMPSLYPAERLTDSELFETSFIARCVGIASELGLSHSELARRVWPNHGDPVRHWRSVRSQTTRITLTDAHRLAGVLGWNLMGGRLCKACSQP